MLNFVLFKYRPCPEHIATVFKEIGCKVFKHYAEHWKSMEIWEESNKHYNPIKQWIHFVTDKRTNSSDITARVT